MTLGPRTEIIRRQLFATMKCLTVPVLAVATIGCIAAAFAAHGKLLSVTMFSLIAALSAWGTFQAASHWLRGSSYSAVFIAFVFSLGAQIAARVQKWRGGHAEIPGAGWKHMNAALEDEEVRAALRWLPIAIVHFSLYRKVRFCNPAYCRLYGFDEDEFVEQSPPMPEEYVEQWRGIEEELRHGKIFFNVETVRLRKDGTLFRAYISGFPLFGDDGELAGLLGVIVDAEQVATGSMAYEDVVALADRSNDFLLLLDTRFRIAYANPAFTKTTDVEEAEVQGSALTEYFREQDRTAVQRELNECLFLGQSKILRNIYISDGMTGQEIPVSLESYLVYRSDCATPKAIACVIHDLQEETELRNRLAQSEKEREALFQNAAVAMVKLNTKGIAVAANAKLQEMLGYSEEEIKERYFSELVHPDDLMRGRDLFVALSAGEIQHYEIVKRLIRKDGTPLPTLCTASLIRDAAGKPVFFFGVLTPVSEHCARRAEQELPCSDH